MPEVLEEGVTGYIVDGADAAVEAVSRVDAINRRTCRKAFDACFTSARMARDSVAVYEAVLKRAGTQDGRVRRFSYGIRETGARSTVGSL